MIQQEAVVDENWEYRRLRLPPGTSRPTATTQLAVHAEFSGWELSQVRLYSDGTRSVWLRRKLSHRSAHLPGLMT